MYKIGVPKRINQIVSLFYFIGFWQGDNVSDTRESISKIFFLAVYLYYPSSLAAGAIITDNEDERIFLVALSITSGVLAVRLYYILWKKNEILEFIRKLGAHSIRDSEQFEQINNRINILMKCVTFLALMLVFAVSAMTIITSPIVSNERKLPLNIYFPLNWKHNKFYYSIGVLLINYEMACAIVSSLQNAILWYLMMSCAIKYQILSTDFKQFGFVSKEDKGSFNRFHADLILLIKNHQELQKTTEYLKSCYANLFFIQIATSAASICGSVYSLAFIVILSLLQTYIENPVLFIIFVIVIVYNFFDILIVTHLGDEITFASSSLSYSLFESNWINMTKSCKKSIFILMEVLKRPQELVVGKVYRLDLTIFTQILKLAYSMFNILQSFK